MYFDLKRGSDVSRVTDQPKLRTDNVAFHPKCTHLLRQGQVGPFFETPNRNFEAETTKDDFIKGSQNNLKNQFKVQNIVIPKDLILTKNAVGEKGPKVSEGASHVRPPS